MFARVDAWTGQFSAAVKLQQQAGTFKMVIALVYGSAMAMANDLWRELAGVMATFQGSPILRGDFNVTLKAKDKPNDMGGRNPNSDNFWVLISEVTLIEMGLVDCLSMEELNGT